MTRSAEGRAPRQRLRRGRPASRPRPLRLFRFQPGLSRCPDGPEDRPPAGRPGGPSLVPTPTDADPGPDWLQLVAGADNPYFDFRQRGDPGGLGFYRVYSQVQV